MRLSLYCCLGLVKGITYRGISKTRVLKTAMASFEDESNPLLKDWTTLHGIPPFSEIQPAHFKPAFESAIAKNIEDIKAIVENTDEPTFENTIAAFDRAGRLMDKVGGVFHNLCSSCNPPELQAVELEMAAPLAAHR